jgi:hypothetical protein
MEAEGFRIDRPGDNNAIKESQINPSLRGDREVYKALIAVL